MIGISARSYCRFGKAQGYYCRKRGHRYCAWTFPATYQPPNAPANREPSIASRSYDRGNSTHSHNDELLPLPPEDDDDNTAFPGEDDPNFSENAQYNTPYSTLHAYDPRSLPMRNDAEFREQAYKITEQENTTRSKLHGINHLPVLHELQTIDFTRSFPLDFMHLAYEGLSKLMVQHWIAEFFPKDCIPDERDPYVLSNRTWEAIGQDLEESVGQSSGHLAFKHKNSNWLIFKLPTFPSVFGKAPRDISKYKNGNKASEWMNWLTIFSAIVLKNCLPEPFYSEWVKFWEAIGILRGYELNDTLIGDVEDRIIDFVEHYDRN